MDLHVMHLFIKLALCHNSYSIPYLCCVNMFEMCRYIQFSFLLCDFLYYAPTSHSFTLLEIATDLPSSPHYHKYGPTKIPKHVSLVTCKNNFLTCIHGGGEVIDMHILNFTKSWQSASWKKKEKDHLHSHQQSIKVRFSIPSPTLVTCSFLIIITLMCVKVYLSMLIFISWTIT